MLLKNLYADFGYDMIALPKAGIEPLTLLCLEGDYLSSLECPLQALFEPDLAPKPKFNTAASTISGNKKMVFDLNSNLGFLKSIFQNFGISGGTLDTKASASHNYVVNFSFDQVQEDVVRKLDLDNYLTGAIPLEKEFRTYMDKLKRSELCVITSVLKSNSFSISINDETGRNFDLDAGLQEVASAGLNITKNNDQGFNISHKDGPSLVFAYKASKIFYNKAAWFEFWRPKEAGFTIKSQQGLTLRGESDFPDQPIFVSDKLTEIDWRD